MPFGFQEGHEICRLDGSGQVVAKGMKVDWRVRHHPGLQNNSDLALSIIDHRKWRHRAGNHPQMGHQSVGFAETQPLAANDLGAALDNR